MDARRDYVYDAKSVRVVPHATAQSMPLANGVPNVLAVLVDVPFAVADPDRGNSGEEVATVVELRIDHETARLVDLPITSVQGHHGPAVRKIAR